MTRYVKNTFYSFPCQLLLLHLRSNLLLLFTWVFLVLLISGAVGKKFGIRVLFLSPEYLGKVDFWSFFCVGVAFGSFFMTWNLTCYLLEANRFPFLASLGRPFTKFCVNNFLIPLGFFVYYLISQITFGLYYEFSSLSKVLMDSLGFISGIVVLVGCLGVYFNFTNQDILSLERKGRKTRAGALGIVAKRKKTEEKNIRALATAEPPQRVDIFLTESCRPRLVRSVAHYPVEMLLRVFRQNHKNVLVVQLFSLAAIVLLGSLIENPHFRIPAAASIFLLGNMVMALAGAISYWFQEWRYVVVMVLLLLINYLTRFDLFHHRNKAFGLDYSPPLVEYSPTNFKRVFSDENVERDIRATEEILDRWKARNVESVKDKPPVFFFCVSGGGLKAATWAMRVLQKTDEVTEGRFLRHIVLMSGASGGLIGTAFYRELALRRQQGEPVDLSDPKYLDWISKDLLNSVAFTIVSNDLFLPWATFRYKGLSYKKDRGYIFEKQLLENTAFLLDKSVADYRLPEQEALIPMLYVTPSIINDGRRLVISAQGVSFMMAPPVAQELPQVLDIDAVDFGALFRWKGADQLRFTTALRMNATYPYILPNVFLPSQPSVEIMDAGFRDNFGLKSATRFIHVFKDWLDAHAGKVVIVVVRAYDRERRIRGSEKEGVFEALLNPVGIAGKMLMLQNYEHDTNLGFLYDMLGRDKLEVIRFTYFPSEKLKDVPISFHLTEREKLDIIQAIDDEPNRRSLRMIEYILEE